MKLTDAEREIFINALMVSVNTFKNDAKTATAAGEKRTAQQFTRQYEQTLSLYNRLEGSQETINA